MGREIKANAVLMRKLLEDGEQRWEMGWDNMECPLIHLRFVDKWIDDASAENIFEIIASEARNKGVLVYASVYLPQEFGISDKADPRPSLRIVVTRMHTKEQLEKCANVVKALLLDAVEKRNGYTMDGMDDTCMDQAACCRCRTLAFCLDFDCIAGCFVVAAVDCIVGFAAAAAAADCSFVAAVGCTDCCCYCRRTCPCCPCSFYGLRP